MKNRIQNPRKPRRSAQPFPAACALIALLGACQGQEERALPTTAPSVSIEDAARCDDGDAMACANLGAAWLDGSLGNADVARATRLLTTACTDQAWLACVSLAELQDDDTAVGTLRAACAHEPAACLALGRRHEVPESKLAAFQAACDERILAGCTEQAMLRAYGDEAVRDLHIAVPLLRSTCNEGEMAACRELARLVAEPSGVFHEPEHVVVLLERACAGGDAEGCAMRAAHQNAATPEGAHQADIFRRRACELGWAPSCEQ